MWSAEEVRGGAALPAVVRTLADPALDGREEGSPGSAIVQRMLVDQLRACGVQPAGEQGFRQAIRTGRGTNLLGRVAGVGQDPQVIVVSAHYDHQDLGWRTHPGAQDNAAAVGALLQVGCALAEAPAERDVILAFWDAEEPPTFLTSQMGSRYWHAHPTVALDRVGAVVVLDLLGGGLWDGYGTTFALGAETSPQLWAAAEATPTTALHRVQQASLSLVEEMVVGPSMVWSDYEVFRAHRIPVLFLTDGQNDRYHTPRDTSEALDYDKLGAEARWLEALVRRLGAGPSIRWSPAPRPEHDRAAVRTLLTEALAAPETAVWGATARGALQASLQELQTGQGSTRDVRAAAQRLMCWAGPRASVFTCGLL
ncbi:MAG: M28 family peptidase [Myxococcales bacterium]|nr:M28 family peptidase [Myxococcales bacterium]